MPNLRPYVKMGNHPLENNRDERLRRRLQPEWNDGRCIVGKGSKAKSVGGRFKLFCYGVDRKMSRNLEGRVCE